MMIAGHSVYAGREHATTYCKANFSLPSNVRVVKAPDASGQMIDWYSFGPNKPLVRIKTRAESVAELEHCL